MDRMNRTGFVLFWIIAISALAAAMVMLWPMLPAVLWAVVFSVLVYPTYRKMREKGRPELVAALAVTMIPTLVLVLPFSAMGFFAGAQVYDYAQEFVKREQGTNAEDGMIVAVGQEVQKIVEPVLSSVGVTNVDIPKILQENQSQITQRIGPPFAAGLRGFVTTVVILVISLLTTFFMVKDAHRLREPVCELLPLPRQETIRILTKMGQTIRAVFGAVVIVALIQGALCGVAYILVGVPAWPVWTLLTCALAMIPLVGAPFIYVPIGAALLVQGKITEGVALLAFCGLFVSQIDNVIRPFFISAGTNESKKNMWEQMLKTLQFWKKKDPKDDDDEQGGLHPMGVFFALVCGVLALGPIGLMAGPMLLTFLIGVSDVLRVWNQQHRGEPSDTASTLDDPSLA